MFIKVDYDEGLGKPVESLEQTVYQQYNVAYTSNDKEESLDHRRPLTKIVIEGNFME
jgi:hypothetical protein